MFEDRNFLIVPISQIGSVNFDEVLETSADTVRKSLDGTRFIIKWDGTDTPACVANLSSTEGPYNHTDILNLLTGSDWTDPNLMKL